MALKRCNLSHLRQGAWLLTDSYFALQVLAASLDEAVREDDAYFNKLIRILATRCMTQAQYFGSGECSPPEYLHYGLAAPLYTHFTSPIRRQANSSTLNVSISAVLAMAISLIEWLSCTQTSLRLSPATCCQCCQVCPLAHQAAYKAENVYCDRKRVLKVGMRMLGALQVCRCDGPPTAGGVATADGPAGIV